MTIDKEGFILLSVIAEIMMAECRNKSPENSKIPFCESESLKDNVSRCVGLFYLSHDELLMDEFGCVLNEKCTGC